MISTRTKAALTAAKARGKILGGKRIRKSDGKPVVISRAAQETGAAANRHVIVVYKVDRLTRSLADFAKLVELFDAHGVSFVSVTQQFNWRRRFNSRSFFFGGRSRKQRACRSGALGQFELGLSRKAIIRVPRRLVVFQNMETQSIAIILE